MSFIEYFPLGLAEGHAFCNREKERKKILNNIQACQHTILISPRRYGKSSLVLHAAEELGLAYEAIDLFVALNPKMLEEQILKGVKNLLNKISSKPEVIVNTVNDIIKKLKSKWIIGTDGINIELVPDEKNDITTNIMESLLLLEELLRKHNKKAVFFIDEFQEIGILANSRGIEGAIRHVAQKSKHLCFLFSGSNRHILANMFDDRTRPLYMLCDRINLERIAEEDYKKYLNKVAKKAWRKSLPVTVFEKIIQLTERHPYYMNVLCGKVWEKYVKKLPSEQDVTKLWEEYILQEKSKTAKEIGGLSIAQKKILLSIARAKTLELTGKVSLKKLGITSAAVIKALRSLEENDYIVKEEKRGYRIIDSLIKSSLLYFYPE